MAVTITPAAARDRQSDYLRVRHLGRDHVLLAATSMVAMLAIGLAYAGRVRTLTPGTAVTNLNRVAAADALEPALERVFTSRDDRRFAAGHLLTFVQSFRAAEQPIPNVGAILAATVPVDAIERSSAQAYRARLHDAFERARQRGAEPPVHLALFTPDQLAVLKPAFVVRSRGEYRQVAARSAAFYLAAIWAVALVWWLRASRGDVTFLIAAHLLTAVGFAAVLSRSDPLRDTVLFVRFTQGVVFGCAAFAATSLMDLRRAQLAKFTYLPLAVALALSAVLLLFGGGPAGSGARVNLGPIQPVEGIRLLLGLFLAGYFARRWQVLRQIRVRRVRDLTVPAWLHLPRLEYVLPVTVGIAAALLFFFLQKDLGPALFLSCVFLAMYAIARNRAGMALAGFGALIAGFYVGYVLNISTALSARVEMWRSAWDNGARGGDQIAQALWALATGGAAGTGLGLGTTRYIPAGYTDLPLAAVGEELGAAGVLVVALTFTVIAVRGFRTALGAADDYGFFLATVLTLFLVLPVLIMAGGMLGVVPLTGMVTPFLSYGGSAMVANFMALGLLTSIRSTGTHVRSLRRASHPLAPGVRTLSAVLCTAGLALVVMLLDVQVVRADGYAVRPHLGLQADGVRRYQYNQRVLDVSALASRGTVSDRNGLPLATSDYRVVERAATAYRKRGVPIAACDAADDRCYPLGGAAFHLLGDVTTRRNWAASNTSYVERDLQDRLRGFDDRASVRSVRDDSGRAIAAVRRDYRDLVPLLRHRHQLEHPAVKAFQERTRDVTLTIDAPLQLRVASILATYAARSATGRAAAVVLDAETGDVLAAVSYPFPGAIGPGDDAESDVYFDRARYGLYAPGSTFKLVTAVAALRLDPGNWRTRLTCTHQPGGRVGARISGHGVVRDDDRDTRPHGSIAMRDGIVRSCNAYFAQLAVRLGAQPLLDTAALLGMSVARDNSVTRLADTLPHAGYGQGDVVATPLRMARVAAAIADGGLLRETRLEASPGASGVSRTSAQRLLSGDAAALLGRSLRDAVLAGTGRSLATHKWRIAGKTGTAEVSDAPSHAWFVGFAPYGAAEKKVAFAVVIENAGYGGASAAPAAGEIVTAAAERGLIR